MRSVPRPAPASRTDSKYRRTGQSAQDPRRSHHPLAAVRARIDRGPRAIGIASPREIGERHRLRGGKSTLESELQEDGLHSEEQVANGHRGLRRERWRWLGSRWHSALDTRSVAPSQWPGANEFRRLPGPGARVTMRCPRLRGKQVFEAVKIVHGVRTLDPRTGGPASVLRGLTSAQAAAGTTWRCCPRMHRPSASRRSTACR